MEDGSKIEGTSHKMPIQQKNLTSAELLNIFELEMKDSTTFRFIGEAKNPCNLIFKGKEFYVYIKNLSSAYFSNIDVSRAQLTGVDSLLEIKKTDALFVLLGYDVENRVFAAWNPHVAKQRIGTAASPSFYSRYSWQKEANDIGKFIKRELKNDGTVLLFPQKYVSHFFEKIDKFFPDTSEYVAMGSKRRRKANAAYRELTNTENLSEFGQYLSSHDYGKSIQEFISVIKSLIKGSLISDNRKIFLAYNSLSEYHDAANDFLNLDEVKRLDEQTNNVLSKAFKKYIDFLIGACVLEKPLDSERTIESQDTSCAAIECKDREVNPLVEVNEVGKGEVGKGEVDYEALYTNENGLLTCIANPKLIDLLREDLDKEYPRLLGAYSTIEDFYGNRFPNMQMSDWQYLFQKIDWKNPYLLSEEVKMENKGRRSSRQKIRIVLPDGREICDRQVASTLIEVIRYAGVEKVHALNISMGRNGGSPLISTSVNPKYANSFKKLCDGLYVNTCSNTETKFIQIQKINSALGLNLKIYLE